MLEFRHFVLSRLRRVEAKEDIKVGWEKLHRWYLGCSGGCREWELGM